MYIYFVIFPFFWHQFPKCLLLIMQISILYFSPISYNDHQCSAQYDTIFLFHLISYHSPFCGWRNSPVSFCSPVIPTSFFTICMDVCPVQLQGSHTHKLPKFGLMFCYCHLKNYKTFWTRGPTSSWYSGHCKWHSWCYLLPSPSAICSTIFCVLTTPTSFPFPDLHVYCFFSEICFY